MKPTKPKSIADLTVEQVNKELRKLVAEQPEFAYAPGPSGYCHYNRKHDDGPECNGCIFGQVFQRLGVPQDSHELGSTLSVTQLWVDLNNESPPGSWYTVQKYQDSGYSWGSPAILNIVSKL